MPAGALRHIRCADAAELQQYLDDYRIYVNEERAHQGIDGRAPAESSDGDRVRLLAAVGLGYFPVFVNGKAALGTALLPLGLRGLYGFGAHPVEVGLAVTKAVALDDAGRGEGLQWGSYLTPSLGYRYSDLGAGRWSLGLAHRASRRAHWVFAAPTTYAPRSESCSEKAGGIEPKSRRHGCRRRGEKT